MRNKSCFGAGKMAMKRIVQTTIVSITLLFCVQGAQAAVMPIAHDFGNTSFVELGGFHPDPTVPTGDGEPFGPGAHPIGEMVPFGQQSVSAVTVADLLFTGDSQYETWFGFNLASAASLTLDTLGSFEVEQDSNFMYVSTGVALDTILALYFGDEPARVIEQNDDCGLLVTSCLSFDNLAAGDYIVGVSIPANGAFLVDDWITSDLIGAQLLGITNLNINLPAPSAVPVPAAVWLFGTALIGFIGMSRRKSVKT
jgi:hypothetical protein